MSDDLPAGKRIWDLSALAIKFESTEPGYQHFEIAEKVTKLPLVEQRFFQSCLEYDSAIDYEEAVKAQAIDLSTQGWMFDRVSRMEGNQKAYVEVGFSAAIEAAERDLRGRVQRVGDQLRDTSEDSYATRNELRDDIAQVNQFIGRVEVATPEKGIDLSREIVDYGYDAEAAACDRMCGLEYVSDFDRATKVYEDAIRRIKPLIQDLERAGIQVQTGVIAMDPPDHEYLSVQAPDLTEREYLAIQEAGGIEHYYLDLMGRASEDAVADFKFRSGLEEMDR